MKRFKGKAALVTGAASGIGYATAMRLASEGADLMLADIDEVKLRISADKIATSDQRVLTRTVDVSSGRGCRQLVKDTVSELGRLDVLCNIAGIIITNHLAQLTDDQWQQMLDININSVFFLSQAAMPHLVASKGNIVNMSSTAALVGQPYNLAYCATKSAILMMSKSMAVEFSGQAVRINAICPGAVATPLTEKFALPNGADHHLFAKQVPLLETAQAKEIAGAIAYLASEEARFVTGTALVIDGGQTAG